MDETTVNIPQYDSVDISSLSYQPAVDETPDISPIMVNNPSVEDRLNLIESVLNLNR